MVPGRVFDELVTITIQLNNVLMGDWKIWRIDFGRGFRLSRTEDSNNLVPVTHLLEG